MPSLLKLSVVFVLIAGMAWACAASQKQTSMTTRQSVLKSIYPALRSVTHFFGVNSKVETPDRPVEPLSSVYDIPFELIDGASSSLAAYKGKKIIVVNTASDCGYTGQYEELQQLYKESRGEWVIVGFPANDFKQQEKGSNEEIASFCKKNYGVEFPMASKVQVVKGDQQHPLFKWLSDPVLNGWNKQAPSWNFSKYVIDEKGRLIGYFDPGVSPLAAEFKHALITTKP